MTRFFGALLTIIFTVCTAHAADPFTVSGVAVDAEGATAIGAQTEAISQGQLAAANGLIERLTLFEERAATGWAGLDIQTAAKLIRGMEIANERRSANRYLGDITVAFNPAATRDYIAANNMNMIATQARMRLVLPVLGQTNEIWTENEWRAAWEDAKFTHALTPMQGIQPGIGSDGFITASQALSGDMDALKVIGGQYGVNQILVARLDNGFAGPMVSLTDYGLDTGRKTDFGNFNAADIVSAAALTVQRVENEWKAAAVNTAQNAVTAGVSVLYNSHSEWQRLQEAINGSSQITDARLDALSKDGALMTISYGGDLARLGNELSFKGVTLKQDETLGTVMTLAGR